MHNGVCLMAYLPRSLRGYVITVEHNIDLGEFRVVDVDVNKEMLCIQADEVYQIDEPRRWSIPPRKWVGFGEVRPCRVMWEPTPCA